MKKKILFGFIPGLLLAAGSLFLMPAYQASAEAFSSGTFQNGYKVCLDPGHQGWNVDMSASEPNGPGSSEMKMKATSGTAGSYTGVPEYQLNLDIALMLRDELQTRGYETVLTRENNDTAISNKERAELAGSAGCDIMVRIHANGDDTHTMSGALTMAPSAANPYVAWLSPESARLSQCILDAYCAATGFANQGVVYTDTMTGINWSTIPVTIIEMGYMTHQVDDTQMNDPAVRVRMVQGIADGIDAYFGIDRSALAPESGIGDPADPGADNSAGDIRGSGDAGQAESSDSVWGSGNAGQAESGDSVWGSGDAGEVSPETGSGESLEDQGMLSPPSSSGDSSFVSNTSDERITEVLSRVQQMLPAGNGTWSVYVCNLANDTSDSVNNGPMQAASLIKLFIMGAVYERYDSLAAVYGASSLDSNLYYMITVSDNTAANTLVQYLGGGDSSAGMNAVNQFCLDHQYGATSMGRLLLQSNESGDNYTSAEDCGRFLREIYQAQAGTIDTTTLSHTKEMFDLLQQQTRRNKIPAQMPPGVSTANKTGELADVENDAAIIFNTGNTDLVIVFLSEHLNNVGGAQASIAGIARYIYDFYNAAVPAA